MTVKVTLIDYGGPMTFKEAKSLKFEHGFVVVVDEYGATYAYPERRIMEVSTDAPPKPW